MVLQSVWFILWSLLWAVYFILDGFDLGIGAMLPCLAHNEDERRIMYNAAGPFWDGNEVWLISAGGVTFAAFPKVYATMFSALYAPLLMLLFALIFRAVSFEFRGKVEGENWRKAWDVVHFISNLVPAILLGVAFANLFMGIPVSPDANGFYLYHGNLLKLLNPYGLAGGLFFLAFFMMHGCLWLAFKSEGELKDRAVVRANQLWIIVLVLLVVFLALTFVFTDLFQNYFKMPALFLIPVVALVGLLGVKAMLSKGKVFTAWVCSAVFCVAVTFFGTLGMFPRMIISSMNGVEALGAFNASSSQGTLTIMLVVALIFVPIVLVYQFLVYKTFSFKITKEYLDDKVAHAY